MKNLTQFVRGPYCMKELKGYNRYYRFVSAEYDLRLNPHNGKRWARDYSLPTSYTAEKRYSAYQEALLSLLSYDDTYDHATPLDLLERARCLKQSYFPDWWQAALNRSLENHAAQAASIAIPTDRHAAIRENALFPDVSGKVQFYGIEQWQDQLYASKSLLLVSENRESFLHDLLTWVTPFYQNCHIGILVKKEENPFTVSKAFAKACLDAIGIESSHIHFLHDSQASVGVGEPEILEQFSTLEDGCVVVKGVWNYFSLFKGSIPFLFTIHNKEDIARGLLQKAYSPSQPESLYAVVGHHTRPFPDDVSITGQDFNELSLEAFLNGEQPKTIPLFLERKQREAESIRFLSSPQNENSLPKSSMQRLFGFFRIASLEENNQDSIPQVIQVNGPGKNHAYVQGLLFEPSECTISPQRFNHLTLLSNSAHPGPVVLSNFSYFFTANLQHAYNDRVSSEEALRMVDFSFDYKCEYAHGERRETVPLYRKGYFGARDNGTLFIGYLTMQKAVCTIAGAAIRIPGQAINPGLQEDFRADPNALRNPHSVRLFTPVYPEERIGTGRINLVIINDTVVHLAVDQEVTVPPVGVVLSFTHDAVQPIFSQIQMGTTVKWDVAFRNFDKSTAQWLYGGYNILMLNGENLAQTPETLERSFRNEGWYLPQSMQTQETQLQDGSRHPRLLLGTTRQRKNLIVAISGRTQISCGATHAESVLYCQRLVPPQDELLNLINLDGGASVFLEARESGKSALLNFPAPSDLNPAGVVRPNSAVLTISPRAAS